MDARRGGLTVAVALLVAACSSGGGGPDPVAGGQSEVLGEADEGIDGVQSIRVYYERPVHFDGDVPYDMHPPAGGMHNPVPSRCGFYAEPVQDVQAVHDLEHGAIWLAYSPDLDAADVDMIRAVVQGYGKVVAAPYEGLDDGVALVVTAWARQLTLERVDDPRLVEFVERYLDGRQAPEAGAGC